MHIKKYQAPDMRRALKKVTDDLGSDAVILSNRKIEGGVELWASIGTESPVIDSNSGQDIYTSSGHRSGQSSVNGDGAGGGRNLFQAKRSNRSLQEGVQRIKKNGNKIVENELNRLGVEDLAGYRKHQESKNISRIPEEAVYSEQKTDNSHLIIETLEKELSNVREDLRKQRAILREFMESMRKGESRTPSKPVVESTPCRDVLLKMGFRDPSVCNRLERLCMQLYRGGDRQIGWDDIKSVISRELSVAGSDVWEVESESERLSSGKYLIIGPTGVGKTTTIGKIANRFLMEQKDSSKLALVTTDLNNAGSVELLKGYAKKLGCAFYKVSQGKQLQKTLNKLRNKSLVLVDTAGLTSNDPSWGSYCEHLLELKGVLEPVIVLPSTAQHRVLESIVEDYRQLDIQYAVISKLDECLSMGEVLSVIMQYNLLITYVTDGLSLADDIHLLKGNELIGFAKHLADQGGCSVGASKMNIKTELSVEEIPHSVSVA